MLVGGEDCHAKASGAHTGDISAEMLRDAGASHVIVGHSERRTDHGETDAIVRAKAEAAWRAGLLPIVCIGETLAEREAGRTLACSRPSSRAACRLARPRRSWSWPTSRSGRSAPARRRPPPKWPQRTRIFARCWAGWCADAAAVRLLYGGSMKASNAAELLAAGDVDGGLIGGASLKADEFLAIAKAA